MSVQILLRTRLSPHRGELDTSGFSDYLWFTCQLLAIDIGSNGGGHRASDYAKLAKTNFQIVQDATLNRQYGLWNVDAFIKKNSGRGFKRAPHLIFDRGVKRAVVGRFKLLSDPSKRNPEWSTGIVGTGSDAKPGNGIRLFLQPLDKANFDSPIWFKNVSIGKHHIQPLSLIAPLIIAKHGPSCGIVVGVDYGMTALRALVADWGPEVGMPHCVNGVITGHGLLAQKIIVMDKNMRPYHEQLAMDLENQCKCGMVMSNCGRDFPDGQRPFHWCDQVPPFVLDVIRRTLPQRTKACGLDCRLIAKELIASMVAEEQEHHHPPHQHQPHQHQHLRRRRHRSLPDGARD